MPNNSQPTNNQHPESDLPASEPDSASNPAASASDTAASAEPDSASNTAAGDVVLWREIYNDGRRQLTQVFKEDLALDVRRMVETASGCEPNEFHDVLNQQPTVRMVSHFDVMLQRRLKGEPLQYVLGSWGFRYLDLAVDSRVLIPRPETEIVTGFALAELDRISAQLGDEHILKAADLGTGSGCIGLSLAAENHRVRVYASDLSADAISAARANLAGLGRAATRVMISQGSWFEALDENLKGELSLVVSNPPYIADGEELPAEVEQWEPHSALYAGPDGLESAKIIIAESLEWLIDGGSLVLELGSTQLETAKVIAQNAGYVDVKIEQDLTGHNRCLIARKGRSDKTAPDVAKPAPEVTG